MGFEILKYRGKLIYPAELPHSKFFRHCMDFARISIISTFSLLILPPAMAQLAEEIPKKSPDYNLCLAAVKDKVFFETLSEQDFLYYYPIVQDLVGDDLDLNSMILFGDERKIRAIEDSMLIGEWSTFYYLTYSAWIIESTLRNDAPLDGAASLLNEHYYDSLEALLGFDLTQRKRDARSVISCAVQCGSDSQSVSDVLESEAFNLCFNNGIEEN
ncbi:hypothetical protein [Ruegeria atlantica]|uniref:hypothetical protein n=1 Tax=Ruegeria atlantica TaxID=81569 RepID=UPI00147FB07E|nr:hypothetical protein [Ruegeria atlantica]